MFWLEYTPPLLRHELCMHRALKPTTHLQDNRHLHSQLSLLSPPPPVRETLAQILPAFPTHLATGPKQDNTADSMVLSLSKHLTKITTDSCCGTNKDFDTTTSLFCFGFFSSWPREGDWSTNWLSVKRCHYQRYPVPQKIQTSATSRPYHGCLVQQHCAPSRHYALPSRSLILSGKVVVVFIVVMAVSTQQLGS